MLTQEFLAQTYFLMTNQKWVVLLGGLTLFHFLKPGIQKALTKLIRITEKKADNLLVKHLLQAPIEAPLAWLISCILVLIFIETIELPHILDKYISIIFKIVFGYQSIRLAYLAADAVEKFIQQAQFKTNVTTLKRLSPLIGKTLKLIAIVVGSLLALQNLGLNVTALLAGLGIGGIALAFAAQDTVANLFGTLTIFLDSPFEIGDRIKVSDIDGIVEDIGFRSTRIRTAQNSVVTLPNSAVAKEKIDNLTDRGNVFRFRSVFTFTYDSSAEQLDSFCKTTREFLRNEKIVDPEKIAVYFTEYAESSMNVLVQFFYFTEDASLELEIQHQYLIKIAAIAEAHGLQFAFPTRTVVVEKNLTIS